MKKYQEALQGCPLFAGIAEEELPAVLECLGARVKQYGQGEAILPAGEPAGPVGVLLAGRAQIVREERDGSRAILDGLRPGELFAEAFACANGRRTLPVTVAAAAPCAVLLIDCERLLAARPPDCAHHARLLRNLLAVLAGKTLLLNRRVGHLSRRTTREKVLSYLKEEARRGGGAAFTIPFSRQELADYLCVDRSALSAVLGKLRDEGILEFRRSSFCLLRREDGSVF